MFVNSKSNSLRWYIYEYIYRRNQRIIFNNSLKAGDEDTRMQVVTVSERASEDFSEENDE